MIHYKLTKSALINLAPSLAKTYGADGILVNAVSPAFIGTPGVEEVASTVSFLCSERASYVNGANFRVDGGSVGSVN